MSRRVLVIDNYDSFTFNLVASLEGLGARCEVVTSDAVCREHVLGNGADAVLLSPGPCSPAEASVMVEVARHDARPILGVCLGHQSIAVAFGADIVRAAQPVHGKTSHIFHDAAGIFRGLPQGFRAARYHSLAVRETSLSSDLVVTARADDGEIMALRHRTRPIVGVQFHPESFASEHGREMLESWLDSVPPARRA